MAFKKDRFTFYIDAWMEPELQSCSDAAQGFWLKMICYMHIQTPRGVLPADLLKVAEIMGVEEPELRPLWVKLKTPLFDELEEKGVFSRPGRMEKFMCILTHPVEPMAIVCRRLYAEWYKSELNRQKGQRGGVASGSSRKAKKLAAELSTLANEDDQSKPTPKPNASQSPSQNVNTSKAISATYNDIHEAESNPSHTHTHTHLDHRSDQEADSLRKILGGVEEVLAEQGVGKNTPPVGDPEPFGILAQLVDVTGDESLLKDGHRRRVERLDAIPRASDELCALVSELRQISPGPMTNLGALATSRIMGMAHTYKIEEV